MSKSSARRNKTFDTSQAAFVRPQNRLQANRWLAMVGFGAGAPRTDIAASTKTNIVPLAGETDDAARLMATTYAAWLDEQFADDSIPNVETNTFGMIGNGHYRLESWWWTQAVHGTAQARFKLAWALSQIFAVNARSVGGGLSTGFYQRLVTATVSNNTSTFRQLLSDVTYTQAMTRWLTYDNNTRENGSSHPDENYARELLQLFTIGLEILNEDGTPVLDSNGIPVQTYGPADIPAFAPFFTGLRAGYEGVTVDAAQGEVATAARYGSYPESGPRYSFTGAIEHEFAAKTLFAYPNANKVVFPAQLRAAGAPEWLPKKEGYLITVINANTFTIPVTTGHRSNIDVPFSYRLGNNFTGTRYDGDIVWNSATPTIATITRTAHGLTTGTRIYALGNVKESIEFALDYVFNHPNVPPFIARSLIKLLVTSNPSPDYVKRVALKFKDNGNGVRGDLSAVYKAIFLDREAIVPYAVSPKNFGRYTTILDRLMLVARAFRDDTVMVYRGNQGGLAPYFSKPRSLDDYSSCCSTYAPVFPMASPSVFNFYRPGYVPPSTRLGDLNLTSPEMQLLSAEQQVMWFNLAVAICHTSSADISWQVLYDGDITNVKGGEPIQGGVDLSVVALTVTAVDNANSRLTVSGTRPNTFTAVNGYFGSLKVIRRRDGKFIGNAIAEFGLNGSATISGQLIMQWSSSNGDTQVGDVLDALPMAVFPAAGIGYPKHLDGGGNVQPINYPQVTLFYKLASFAPSGATPGNAEYDAIINYLQDKLMTTAISAEIKSLMIAAANAITTAEAARLAGNAVVNEHYLNWVGTITQKRARVMLAILLASPEFCIQR